MGLTPVRDELSINELDTPSQQQLKESVKGIFGALPKPSNDYEIDVSAFGEGNEDADVPDGHVEEDAAEREERERKELRAKEDKAMSERSTALKRRLPRPVSCAEEDLVFVNESDAPDYQLAKEMFDMVADDSARFPVRSKDKKACEHDPAYVVKSKSSLPYYTPEELSAAKTLLKEELVNVMAEEGFPEPQDCDAAWEECMQPTRDLAQLQHQFETLQQQMKRDAKKANKLEKRLMTLNGGYEKRSAQLIKDIQDKFEKYQEAQRQLASFEKLEAQEAVALPKRLTVLKDEVEQVKKRESDLQQRYARLKFELDKAQTAQ